MNRKNVWMAAALIGVLAGMCPAQEQSLEQKVMATASGALARLEFKYHNELMVGDQSLIGQAICIDANGPGGAQVFMTYDIPRDWPEKELKEFTLAPAGGGKPIPAELMGRDIEEGLSFLSAKGGKWSALLIAPKSNLKIGDKVVSVGLLGPNSGDQPYIGTGIVAADLALPNEVIYVTGGFLTIRSSPVMNAAGQVVGIVGDQSPMEVSLTINRQTVPAALAGRQQTSFFVPVDEFAHVLLSVPAPGKARKLSWMGVLNFEPVTETKAEIYGNLGGRPAVIVGKIVPNTPAAAKLQQGDVIVAVDGKNIEKLATPILSLRAFARDLVRRKPDSEVKFSILRDGKPQEIAVKMEVEPARPHEVPIHYNRILGLGVRDLVIWDRFQGAEPLPNGVAVIRVIPESPAAQGQLNQGDLITAVNNKPTPDVATFKQILEPLAKPGPSAAPIVLLVQRGGQPEALNIRVPREAPPATPPTP